MNEQYVPPKAPQRVMKTRREYNSWVVDESIEDFALRYAPKSIRKWSLWTVTNTALSTVSFLAMEAIGATIILQYGFHNAVYALIIVSLIIFLSNWPISYYASKYNLDIDLLTRGAGFGYIGSTITSLIYASFTFIFFAFEAAIMAMALQLALNIPLSLGYLFSALIILPLVIKGIDYINKIQKISQPFWIILLLLPWFFVLFKHPDLIHEATHFVGEKSHSQGFNLLSFGAACTILFALITQIGEQVDYQRFLPPPQKRTQVWHWAVFLGGPFWIILGFFKILMGMLLMILALKYLIPFDQLNNPTYLYWVAYQQIFENHKIALIFMLIFVCISQIKINVTNAYAGSLAWSNFFARLTHSHPGRLVWLIFNIFISILLMELGVIHAVEQVLGLYSNVALAWIGAIVADLIICKPLGLSPKGIEFRRAYLYDINPVGVGALFIASALSILCYLHVFGDVAKALSGFIALFCSMLIVPIMAYLTKGKYYLARANTSIELTQVHTCMVCEHDYESADVAQCPAYQGSICSLCCSLEARCHDLCKPHGRWSTQINSFIRELLPHHWANRLNTRISLYLLLSLLLNIILAACLSLVYLQEKQMLDPQSSLEIDHLFTLFIKIYTVLFLLISVATWWLVLSDESRRKAEIESSLQTQLLMDEIAAHEATDQQLQNARVIAEKANEAKSRYLIGISHELRTPLNSILGYSQLIQKQEILSEQGQVALGVISRSGQHLTSLIDGLLDLARIETGKISLNMSDIDFPNFLDQIIRMFQPQFENKNLKFEYKISPNLPQYVRIDKKRFEQIIINVLGNALKFTSQGQVCFKIDYRFQTAYFEIEDTGCGIAAQDLQRIFNPFERGSNVDQSSFSGTGLGLPIVKLLVDLLGGQLAIESKLNQGTCFKLKLYLPSKSLIHPINNLNRQDILGYKGQIKRILVVDNEAVDRGLVCKFLEPLGFVLDEAESGIECLRRVPIFRPDLILMDLSMPIMNGWETAHLLRQNQITKAPILIISADVNERTKNHQTDVLNEDFLVKPVDLNLLLNKIGDKLGLEWQQTIDESVSSHSISSITTMESYHAHPSIKHHHCFDDSCLKSMQLDEVIRNLVKLSHQGYIRGIKQQLEYCQQQFPQQQVLWEKLNFYVQRFDLKAIAHVLQEFLHDH
ncbi:response regulator [Acinetobacter sp. WU_MDCI_Axc73]|nr:response regulator [Acinetobacter sp. WU_MDCI_Axc73]